jgi:hypothetical protein
MTLKYPNSAGFGFNDSKYLARKVKPLLGTVAASGCWRPIGGWLDALSGLLVMLTVLTMLLSVMMLLTLLLSSMLLVLAMLLELLKAAPGLLSSSNSLSGKNRHYFPKVSFKIHSIRITHN